MIRLARARLAAYGDRAAVTPGAAADPLPAGSRSVDRVVATYVLDLLGDVDAQRFLAEARRVLRPGGLLCVVGITQGTTLISRAVMGAWQWLFARRPSWVGGCRPTRLAAQLAPGEWNVRFRTVVTAWGVASEVVVASPSHLL
jgi:ubiquinone/menaquinone biosynthesis C-methylase UbiE